MNFLDLPEWITNLTGETIVVFILSLARWLTDEGTPGWVSLCLVVALAVLSLRYEYVTQRFVGAVRSVRAILRVEGDGKITWDRLVDIDGKFAKARARGKFYRGLEKCMAGVQRDRSSTCGRLWSSAQHRKTRGLLQP